MPVYEYICRDCRQQFESRVASFRDADTVRCVSCSGENIIRSVSRVAFVGRDSDIPVRAVESSGGGCCGGSCGCGHRA